MAGRDNQDQVTPTLWTGSVEVFGHKDGEIFRLIHWGVK